MVNGARERAESNSSNGSSTATGGNSNAKSKRSKQGNNSCSNKMRPVTVETVRRIVAQEGRSARNLISWNAPLFITEDENEDTKSKSQKPVSTVKRRSKSFDTAEKKNMEASRQSREGKTSGVSRSSSVNKKQVSIRARYWAYLFENLRRAVDEIYATCENDQSVVECKEVLLVLDNYRHEFQALIDWINLQERLNSADITNRPTSLAWEVRKSSPGRPRQRMTPRSGHFPGPYTSPGTAKTNTVSPSPHIKRSNSDKTPNKGSSVTWADKVKGVPTSAKPVSDGGNQTKNVEGKKSNSSGNTKSLNTTEGEIDDDEGWEKVSSKNKQPKLNKNKHTNSRHGQSNKENSNFKKNCDSLVSKEVPTVKKVDTKMCKVVRDKNSNIISPSVQTSHEKDQQLSKTLDFFVDSVGEELLSSPVSVALSSDSHSPSYASVVVERNMGTGNYSQSAKNTKAKTEEKERKCTNKLDKEGEHLNKILFRDDDSLPDNDISLQSLDEVEAEYFKSDPTLVTPEVDDDEASMLASLDESEAKTNQALLEHDASIAAAEQEEQELMKEIEEEEKKSIEPELEEPDNPTPTESGEHSQGSSDWNSIMERYEAEQEQHEGMSWGDMMDEEELREPGRAVQMHEKLSSPSRKRTPAESKRKMEEKQRSATLRREKMVQDKTERIHILTEKVIDVKKLKDVLIDERRELLHDLHLEKLQRAEQQRAMKLMKIVQKAQAEETKVNEILFINELQEQNKRHDVLNRILEHDARLLELQQERSKMHEVKAAKEENVKERRRLLEKERQERLSELINKRKEQDSRIENLKLEKEKEREKIAREKERERKIRLSALNAAQQEAMTELQKKIQLKHDESERRHQEQLEQRKEKALELSLGRFSLSSSGNLPPGEIQSVPSEAALRPSLSGTLDLSSLENDSVKGAKGDAVSTLKNSPRELTPSQRAANSAEEKKIAKEKEEKLKERKKAMKKRVKKLKTRMSARGREFLKAFDHTVGPSPSSNSKNKVYRLIKDINRQLSNQKESSGPWPTNRVSALDRALGEINRLLEKQDQSEKAIFRFSGGFEMIERVFEISLNSGTFQGQKGELVPVIPDKSLSIASNTFRLACERCYDNCLYVLYAGRTTMLVDGLIQQLTKNFPEDNVAISTAKSPTISRKPTIVTPDDAFDGASSSLLRTLSFLLKFLASEPPRQQKSGKALFSDDKSLMRALYKTVTSSKSFEMNELETKRLLEGYLNRGLDVVSYIVSTGVLDKLSCFLGIVRSEIKADSNAASFITNGLEFLSSVTDFVSLRNRLISESSDGRQRRVSTESNASGVNGEKRTSVGEMGLSNGHGWDQDPTQLLPTLYHTELMGVVSVLYGILLHGAPERPTLLRINSIEDVGDVTSSSPPTKKIAHHVLHIAMSVMRVLNAVADLDIELLQTSLGAEGVSLEFRHICTYLLWYCQHGEYEGLLHAVIVCVGHFAIRNRKNQDTVHSGAMPTVLQQLCVLPFAYFSDPRLSDILFPTLIACCHDNPVNLEMLEQEASSSLLSSYIQGVLEDYDDEDEVKVNALNEGKPQITDCTSFSLTSSRLYTRSYLTDSLKFFHGVRKDTNVHANVSRLKL